jgi:hypothetical protein
VPAESRDVRGIPLWLLRDYLVDAGGTVRGDHIVVGDGWQARLTQLQDFEVGSLRVGEIRVEWEGEGEAFERMRELLQHKLLRAGG